MSDDTGDAPPKRRRRVPRWVWAIGVFVVLAVVGGAIVWVNLNNADSKYGPIRAGTFGGEYSHTHLADGPPGTTYITGPAGTEVVRMYSLANNGSHSVKITSISASGPVSRIRWSPWHLLPAGSSYGREVPARNLPATVPPNDEIRLLVTIRKPAGCDGDDGFAPVVTVHWDTLLHSHATVIDFAQTAEDQFYLCKPGTVQ
jgi:hypothetical protein